MHFSSASLQSEVAEKYTPPHRSTFPSIIVLHLLSNNQLHDASCIKIIRCSVNFNSYVVSFKVSIFLKISQIFKIHFDSCKVTFISYNCQYTNGEQKLIFKPRTKGHFRERNILYVRKRGMLNITQSLKQTDDV